MSGPQQGPSSLKLELVTFPTTAVPDNYAYPQLRGYSGTVVVAENCDDNQSATMEQFVRSEKLGLRVRKNMFIFFKDEYATVFMLKFSGS